MASPNVFLAMTLTGVGLLMIALAIPLIKEKVKMNHWYGVRIPKAFESTENWYSINRYGGQQLLLAGMVLGICGIALIFIPLQNQLLTMFIGLLPALILIPVVINIFRFSSNLKKH